MCILTAWRWSVANWWELEMIMIENDVHVHLIWIVGGISESVHFIWKYELISDVHGHFIWHWGVYLNLYTSSENMNSYLMSVGTSSDTGGYIWICTLHLKIWIHILCPCELHLVHFIWYWGVYLISVFISSERLTVTTHIMNSWTLNNLCRLLYVVVIVVTISYSCYFWSFLSVIVHAYWYRNNNIITQ